MIVALTAEAERDLEDIGDHIARDNPQAAVSFVRELRAKCLDLATFPRRFAVVPRYEEHGLRHRAHGDFLIFYRVEAERVVVIHVLHGAMDYGAILFPS